MLPRPAWRSKENPAPLFGGSVHAGLMVAQHLRDDAAACCRRVLTRPAKQLRPYISPQAYSDLHQHGGSLGSVAVLMIAVPEAAQALAAHLQAVADACSDVLRRSWALMPPTIISATAAHLIAMHQLQQYPDSPEALRQYIASIEDLLAVLREAELAARRVLQQLEQPRDQS
jgi:hypothetical protein